MNRLLKIKALGDYRLAVNFTDGWVYEIDLTPVIDGPGIAADLADTALFQNAFVDHGVLTWPNGYDICSDVLRAWCEAGRVLDKAATDKACAAMLKFLNIHTQNHRPPITLF